jgi:hypothetical protein
MLSELAQGCKRILAIHFGRTRPWRAIRPTCKVGS